MSRKELIKDIKTIVVKIGSSTISENGSLSGIRISRLVSDVVNLVKSGYRVVIVSSGAITAGADTLNKKRDTLTIPEKQALASIGQTILINEYRKYFFKKGFNVGQILLTEDDIKNRRRFLNARHTLDALFKLGVIPIINENDSVVVKEIKFGDNDTLSAHVAGMINADLLIMLTDIDGFYRNFNDSKPVEEICTITNDIIECAGGSGTIHGTGGMSTKIKAAEIIIRFGEMMIIADGGEKNILSKIMKGEKIGTIFLGKTKSLSSRKKWLTLKKTKGKVILDNGAVEAVGKRKKSLLASGIIKMEGTFEMGSVIAMINSNSDEIGKGIVNYNSDELNRIIGKSTTSIKKILGSKYFDEVINRDDMILY